jgi:Holliday junction resolvasome RuvABC ATP-dependent DNA helicase subunit
VSDQRLAGAYAAVRSAGSQARLDDDDVAAEAAALAAAVCADAPEAASAWAEMFGRRENEFEGAARDGARWDVGPTPLLAQLAERGRTDDARAYGIALAGLSIESCSLDPDPSLGQINTAGRIARAQLTAADARPVPVPGVPGEAATSAAPAVEPEAAKATEPQPTLPELLARLDGLIGLKDVKEHVHRHVALLRVNKLRAEKGLKGAEVSRHLVFVGNPGTGKTTVARLVAQIYRALGILEKGTFVETDRAGLVAGYLGQTAIKTSEVIQKAIGGLLFIDEAYALTGDQYGDEAIATLVKGMEDHREDLVIIVAGYTEEMSEFIAANPGLESRFATTITFPDYTEDELVAIFEMFCRDADFEPAPELIEKLRELLRAEPRDKGFGNARLVRNLFEDAVARQAWRLRENEAPTVDDLRCLRADDLPETTTA